MRRLTVHSGVIAMMLGAWAIAQTPVSRIAEFEKRSRDTEARELAVPFKGITANGQVEPNLFAVRSSGVSTEPVRRAAAAFLDALTAEQRKKTTFALDDGEWRS